jgi:F0F1-type ATP synthase membrane subunit a
MITIEERTWAAAPMRNARRMTPRNRGGRSFMDGLKGGFALMWDRRIPSRDKIVTLALAVGITACVIAFEIPVEALVIWAFAKAGFIGVMALDGVEALAGPIILSCLLLRSNTAAALAIVNLKD